MDRRVSSNSNLIKAMEVFVAVIKTGQMTAAARSIGITQSVASQYIVTLEATYEAQLPDRSTRPIRPARAGVPMHCHMVRILHSVVGLASDMRHEGLHPISRLRVGLLASIATTLMPGLVALAKDQFGVPDMALHAGQSGDHEAMLRSKRADMAVTSNPFYDTDGLERHHVLTESFLLVLPGAMTAHRIAWRMCCRSCR